MGHARAYIQGANSRNSTITMSMNMEFAAYLSSYLEGMKASTQNKTVRRAFAIVGRKLVAEGKKNLRARQTTHNKTPGHVPLIQTFQSRVVSGKRLRSADMKVYAGFNKYGHHAIWADYGYVKDEFSERKWYHAKKSKFIVARGRGANIYRVDGTYFWSDVRSSADLIGAPLIIKGIDQAMGNGNLMKDLRFDGRYYSRRDLYVVKELL